MISFSDMNFVTIIDKP